MTTFRMERDLTSRPMPTTTDPAELQVLLSTDETFPRRIIRPPEPPPVIKSIPRDLAATATDTNAFKIAPREPPQNFKTFSRESPTIGGKTLPRDSPHLATKTLPRDSPDKQYTRENQYSGDRIPYTGDKPYSTLEGSSFERGLDALLFKRKMNPSEYSGEVSTMIRRLQSEVDTLRLYMDERRKDHDSCIYEKIESKASDKSEYKRRAQALRTAFVYQASSRGLYRVRSLLDPQYTACKKFVWVLILLCCSALLTYQIRDRVLLFLNYDSETRVEVAVRPQLDFPSVTVCNLNTYRLTSLASLNLYDPVHRLTHGDIPRDRRKLRTDFSLKNLSYGDLLKSAAHQAQQLVHGCRWQKEQCSVANFTRVITDRGVCYTFTPSPNLRHISNPGPASGLSLLLNVEQYEYLLGPRSAVGVGVAVHERGTVPRMTVDGIYTATGSHTAIGVHRHQVLSSPSYSDCHLGNDIQPDTETKVRADCSYECELARVLDHCGCLLPYTGYRFEGHAHPCTLSDYFFCAKQLTGRSRQHQCPCTPPCATTKYDIELSQSAMSSYAAESEARLLRGRGTLEKNFRDARDTYHQLDPDIFSYDLKVLSDVSTGFRAILGSLKAVNDSIPTQADNFGTQYSKVVGALKTVNRTVLRTSGSLVKSSHLAFISYATGLEKEMTGILARKSILSKLSTYRGDKLKHELRNFTKTLKNLVVTEPASERPNSIFLEKIMTGITQVRTDLVLGYGQRYLEFRQALSIYNNTAIGIQTYIAQINQTLRGEYSKLQRLIHTRGLQPSAVTKALTDFFATISNLRGGTLNKMKMSLLDLFSLYATHSGNIQKLVNDLEKVGKSFSKATSVIEASLSRLTKSITALKGQVKSIEDTMEKLRKGYENHDIKKTDIGLEFREGGMDSTLDRAKELFEQIESGVKSVCGSGQMLSKAISPITNRIVDMTQLTSSELQTTLDALHYNTLADDIDELKEAFEGNISSVITLQGEVSDYLDANRIDGTFYQSNFLQIDVYFRDLRVTTVSRQPSYGLVDLACDVGGSLALYLGASILTFIEFVDFLCKSLHIAAASTRKL